MKSAKQSAPRDGNDDEQMTSHPMIPGSIMHYVHAVRSQADLPGYQELANRYTAVALRTIQNTIGTATPQFIDHMRMVNIFSLTERGWRAQLEFTELVLDAGEHSVIGFWAPDYPKARTLDTLCSGTINAALLTREPHKADFPFHFHYDEVKDDNSPLFAYVRAQQEVVESQRHKMRLPAVSSDHLSRSLWCIYMLDFTPADITVVRGKFPQARIVGITSPDKNNDEDAILALRQRIRLQQQQMERNQQARQKLRQEQEQQQQQQQQKKE